MFQYLCAPAASISMYYVIPTKAKFINLAASKTFSLVTASHPSCTSTQKVIECDLTVVLILWPSQISHLSGNVSSLIFLNLLCHQRSTQTYHNSISNDANSKLFKDENSLHCPPLYSRIDLCQGTPPQNPDCSGSW